MSDHTPSADHDTERDALFAYLVEFHDVDSLLVGAKAMRDAGFSRFDCHTPFVVHGLDGAMGIKPTKLPWLVFGAGATGTAAGIGLQWFTNAYDYPFLISGKPYFSLPANIPVAFETTILFAAISALLGMIVFNGLPRLSHPLHRNRRFRRSTDDRFFLSVEAADPLFDVTATREMLEGLGGVAVEEVWA